MRAAVSRHKAPLSFSQQEPGSAVPSKEVAVLSVCHDFSPFTIRCALVTMRLPMD